VTSKKKKSTSLAPKTARPTYLDRNVIDPDQKAQKKKKGEDMEAKMLAKVRKRQISPIIMRNKNFIKKDVYGEYFQMS
jgi:hypothetical protein